MKYNRAIEVCEYCDACYHPMMRWTKDNETIFVHSFTFNMDAGPEEPVIVMDDTCEKNAIADGFEKRPDLTPRR